MVSWPAGHRWEDAQVTIYDKTLVHKATLGTAHRFRYNKRLFGNYGAMLTFELDRSDPWVSELTNGQIHFIRVLEDKGDGTRWQTFSGFCIKEKDADEVGADTQFIEFTFLPLARMASWRHGVPVTGETLEVTDKVDDGFKWIIERTLGATAPATPTTSVARAFTGFVVAANKSEYPSNVELKATGQNIYEFLQLTGAAKKVDWDIYLNDTPAPEFETWYPRRGVDRTEDNGVNTECIITDAMGSFRKQEHQYDATDVVSHVLDNRFTKDVGDSDVATNWLYRETAIPSSNEVTMAVELADRAPKRTWTLDEFVESEGCQWGLHFDVGDKVTVISQEFGYTLEDTICDVTVEYDDKGYRHIALTFGDPVPDNQDQQRGGGRRRLDPEYTDPRNIPDMALAILPVANTNVVGVGTRAAPDDHQHLLSLTADDTNIMTLTAGVGNVIGAGGVTTSIVGGNLVISGAGVLNAHALLSATHNDTTAASVVRGDLITGQGASPNTKWTRLAIGAANTFAKSDGTDVGWGVAVIGLLGDAGAGSLPDANGKITIGGVNGYSFNAHDNQVDFTGPWYRDSVAGTVYPVTLTDHILAGRNDQVGAHGLGTTWVDALGDIRVGKYLYATAAALTIYGASGVVDVYDNASACTLNIYNGAAKNIMLDSNGSSYFRGGGVHVENGHSLTLYSDAGTTTTASWVATDGAINIVGGGDLTIQAAGDTKFFIDGATGNTTWKAGATLTLEGVAYLPPAAAPGGAGYALVSAAGSPYQLSWSATTAAAAHNLLSATHGDTLADSVVAGDMIIGNATPKWARLAKGSQYDMLVMGAALPAWSAISNLAGAGLAAASGVLAVGAGDGITVNANDVALTTPGTCTYSSTNSASGNHTHAITTTSTGTASRILALDASGYTRVTRLEVYDDTGYIWRSEANAIQMRAASYAGLKAGDSAYVWLSATDFYPVPTATINNGKSDRRWATYYGVNGDLTGTLDVDGAVTFGSTLGVTGTITGSSTSTAAIFQGNVTIASGKTVDGVDISAWKTAYDAHTHNYIKPVQYHAAGYDGDVATGEGVQTGSYSYYECDYSSDGGTRYYVYTATDSSGTSAAWRRIYFPSKPHYHNVSYDTVASAAP